MDSLNFSATAGNSMAAALRCILSEIEPGERPYSADSYLPQHLAEMARKALDDHEQADNAAHQHIHNHLTSAAWHIARGEAPQALARIRRAQSNFMEGGAA